MRRLTASTILWPAAALFVVSCCHCDGSHAEEKGSGKSPAKFATPTDSHDPYALPKSRVKDLIAFIDEIMSLRPSTNAERQELRQRAYPAVVAAAEKLAEIATEKDKKRKDYRDAIAAGLLVRSIEATTPDELAALTGPVAQSIREADRPSLFAAKAAKQLTSKLGRGNDARAVQWNREFGQLLSDSKDREVAKIGARMEGVARRLTLVGQHLQIAGTAVEGGRFQWTKYRGKVVLIDFWATWCGPCRKELPNVLKNYTAYHDRGFDVVGISLDEDKNALKAFLVEQQIPWTTLNDGGWEQNALADYYGITGIPTVLLVNQEGLVVSISARGDELSRQLEKLLGPAELAGK